MNVNPISVGTMFQEHDANQKGGHHSKVRGAWNLYRVNALYVGKEKFWNYKLTIHLGKEVKSVSTEIADLYLMLRGAEA